MLRRLTEEQLVEESQWLANMLTSWLDDEWTPLEVHRQLGDEAGSAYASLRRSGEDEVADILLGLGSALATFDFRETFTGPFDVANKAAEMLMMRSGVDVCCTSEEDRERVARFGGGSAAGD